MPKAELELDVFPGIDTEGVYATLYVGDSSEPALEVRESWEDLLEREIDYHTVPNSDRPIVVDIDSDSVQEIQNMAEMFRDLADRLEAKMRERPIFLRDKWMATIGGNDKIPFNGTPISDFYVNYEEYLNYKLGYGENNDA